jgi:hypothetical protein
MRHSIMNKPSQWTECTRAEQRGGIDFNDLGTGGVVRP